MHHIKTKLIKYNSIFFFFINYHFKIKVVLLVIAICAKFASFANAAGNCGTQYKKPAFCLISW